MNNFTNGPWCVSVLLAGGLLLAERGFAQYAAAPGPLADPTNGAPSTLPSTSPTAPTPPTAPPAPTPAAPAEARPQNWNLHMEATYIGDWHPGFPAQYS